MNDNPQGAGQEHSAQVLRSIVQQVRSDETTEDQPLAESVFRAIGGASTFCERCSSAPYDLRSGTIIDSDA